MPIALYDKDSGCRLGGISESQRDDFFDFLEAENDSDRDRFVNAEILSYLEEQGADAELVTMLRQAVGESDGVEIECREE